MYEEAYFFTSKGHLGSVIFVSRISLKGKIYRHSFLENFWDLIKYGWYENSRVRGSKTEVSK